MLQYEKSPLGFIIEQDAFDAQTLGKCEAIFAQSNGYMGIRAAHEERYIGERRGAFVTGTFNCADETEVTELPNLPDVTAMEIFAGGERFCLDHGQVGDFRFRLDMRTGEITREATWTSPAGARLQLRARRVVSLADEHVIAARVELTALDADLPIRLESGIDSRVTNTGAQHMAEGEKRLIDGGILRVTTRTSQSRVEVAVHSAHRVSGAQLSALPVMGRRTMLERMTGVLKAGKTLAIEKISCYHTGRDMGAENTAEGVCARGGECIRRALAQGYEAIAQASAEKWAAYWAKHDVRIDSDKPYDQVAVRFALYQLNGMVKRDDSRVGIGAKAMTGEGYKGHSFWDTEMFILPHYLFTDPATARTLLEYRGLSLPGARKKAKENGFDGAMYPWESAWLDDGEVTPLWGAADIVTGESTPILTGMIEHHITSDVAFMVWQYYQATGDEEYMARYGCEILLDTARYWLTRADYNEKLDRYELLDVIGPDEYKEHVDNNAYTNYLAYENLVIARRLLDVIGEKWPQTFARLREPLELDGLAPRLDAMIAKWYLPQLNEDGILPQNDTYLSLEKIDLSKYRNQKGVSSIYEDYNVKQMNKLMVSKQADTVMLFCVLSDLFPAESCRKNFDFYESRTLHDSSLSYAMHSVLASRLGSVDLAYAMFEKACDIDLGQNMKSSDDGIHSASMGGLWQSVVFGFGGLRQQGTQLHVDPHLPPAWKKLSFRFVWQNVPVAMALTQEAFTLKNLGQDPVAVNVRGEDVRLEPGKELTMKL